MVRVPRIGAAMIVLEKVGVAPLSAKLMMEALGLLKAAREVGRVLVVGLTPAKIWALAVEAAEMVPKDCVARSLRMSVLLVPPRAPEIFRVPRVVTARSASKSPASVRDVTLVVVRLPPSQSVVEKVLIVPVAVMTALVRFAKRAMAFLTGPKAI